MPETNANPTNRFVAYLRDRISAIASRKSEQEIAEAIGYHEAATIRRIKDGEARVPLDKVGALAEALEVDPAYLAHIWLVSHVPGGSDLFKATMTPNEHEILEIIRNASGHSDPAIGEEARRQLEAIFRLNITPN